MSSPTKKRRADVECSSSTGIDPENFYTNRYKQERLRLLYMLENTSNDVIVNTLKEAVKESGEKLPSLVEVFDKEKFPAKVAVMSVCTRCGVKFDPHYNDRKSCRVCHPDWDCAGKTYPEYGYMWRCTSCDKEWKTDGLDTIIDSDPDIAYCYVGSHTTDKLSDTDSGSDYY